jgi:2-polyprenyl-3-methyl-5-hydroxy-6-metoxy-1,4-benzoquinol methylase
MNRSDEKRISEIYNTRLQEGLSDYKVVGWGSKESQYLRFKILTEINELTGMSVLDVGCGLGELYNFFKKNEIKIESYKGIDISEDCIIEARKRLSATNQASFDFRNIEKIDGENLYDYIFLSGSLNLKMEDNLSFAKKVIQRMYSLCRKGVACNFLSTYVDFSLEKDYHYSPEEVFSFSKELSNRVVLRHDYPLYEFTIYIYKES